MKINRSKLLDILQIIKPGLANKEIVEQSTHFIFSGENISTYNESSS